MQNINKKTHPSPRAMPYLDTILMESNKKGTYIAIVTAARTPWESRAMFPERLESREEVVW